MNYYNDIDPKVCEWARQLIKEGLVPEGEVDCRSITEVRPSDLKGFTQCHFFCGILGWPLALKLAGWPATTTVWSASLPCQPFSVAGKGLGEKDERHLWPVFRELMRECKPATAFGEQVASKDGRAWLTGVFADLEGMDYQRAGADLCAAGVGAPHIRQRLYWAAFPQMPEREWLRPFENREQGGSANGGRLGHSLRGRFSERVQCDCHSAQNSSNGGPRGVHTDRPCSHSHWSRYDLIPCRDGKARRVEAGTFPLAHGIPGRVGLLRGYGNAIVPQVAAEFIQAFCETQET